MNLARTEVVIFGFSSHKRFSLFGAVVRLVERTRYSHVYFRTRSNSLDRALLYHATGRGLHFISLPRFRSQNRVYEEFMLAVTPSEKKKILQWCVDNSGREYGKMQIIGIGLVRLYKAITGKTANNPFANGGRTQVCDEVAARIINILGYNLQEADIEREGPRWIHNVIVTQLQDRLIMRTHIREQ